MKIIRRTAAFQEYLDRQTPDRAAEIIAGEQTFGREQFERGTVREAAEAQYAEDLSVRVPIEGGDTIERLLDQMSGA